KTAGRIASAAGNCPPHSIRARPPCRTCPHYPQIARTRCPTELNLATFSPVNQARLSPLSIAQSYRIAQLAIFLLEILAARATRLPRHDQAILAIPKRTPRWN